MDIRKLTNRDADFYALMGPFLSQRRIVKDLGSPVWDDPGKRWYIAVDCVDVAGFAAVSVVKAKLYFCSAWVDKPMRCRGIYSQLLDARLDDWRTQPLRATATKASHAALLRCGFTLIREKGAFSEMERKPDA